MVYAVGEDVFQFLRPWKAGAPDASTYYGQLGDFLGIFLNILFGTGLAVSMIAIILAGIKFITAKSDPKAKASAQQSLTFAVVAFVLVVGAYTIKTIVLNVVGGDYGDLRNATPDF